MMSPNREHPMATGIPRSRCTCMCTSPDCSLRSLRRQCREILCCLTTWVASTPYRSRVAFSWRNSTLVGRILMRRYALASILRGSHATGSSCWNFLLCLPAVSGGHHVSMPLRSGTSISLSNRHAYFWSPIVFWLVTLRRWKPFEGGQGAPRLARRLGSGEGCAIAYLADLHEWQQWTWCNMGLCTGTIRRSRSTSMPPPQSFGQRWLPHHSRPLGRAMV